MDDLLSPFGRVIGIAPLSPSVFYLADVTYFFPGGPRRSKMGLFKRDQARRQARRKGTEF
jgi:hypothetical protein